MKMHIWNNIMVTMNPVTSIATPTNMMTGLRSIHHYTPTIFPDKKRMMTMKMEMTNTGMKAKDVEDIPLVCMIV